THKGSATLNLSLSEGKTALKLALALTSSDICRDELFPDRQSYNRRQTAVLPSFQISRFFSASGMDNIQFSYSTNVILPSLEQWRDYLDTQNPYQLAAGNPDLKQSYSHNIHLSTYYYGKDFSLFTLRCTLNFVNDKIARKSRFFTEDTMLPGWGGYVAREQSTLNSYENLDGTFSGDISASYSRQIKLIKSNVDIMSSFMYIKDPSFIQESLVVRELYSPSVSLRLSSNFSRIFRITFGGYIGYNYTENTVMQKDKALNISGTAQTELHILKKIILNTNYSFNTNKGLLADRPVSQYHILNALLGFKLLKGRMEMSVAAYDILNKDTGFSRSVIDNYIITNRSFNYGRYFTINLAYRLFKSNTDLKQPKNIKLNDGGITAE
ncbi:MAG: TonB-dependent receptor, partial [Paludibacter sp.]|nr:TonB-dependent receptor [Paludibacter sp.]